MLVIYMINIIEIIQLGLDQLDLNKPKIQNLEKIKIHFIHIDIKIQLKIL